MDGGLLYLTGFSPFVDVDENPSGLLAERLAGRALGGLTVHGRVLPVTFDGVGPAYAEGLAEMPVPPAALLSLGVHRGASFRLESRARPELSSAKVDNAGRRAAEVAPLGPTELSTGLDLEALAVALEGGGAGQVLRSDDAGGFVCERCYWEVLSSAARLGVPGLFLHVPPIAAVPVTAQLPVVEALIAELARQALGQ